MELEPVVDPHRLYSAVGSEVNANRPLFTGDVYTSVDIPGVGESSAIVIGHPCSFRGRSGRLADRTPVAAVEAHEPLMPQRWVNGYFNRMPLAGLPLEEEFHVARLDLALTCDLLPTNRVVCLSHAGINHLQQRLVFHQTRLVIPTRKFHEAFDHTYEEADLLEEWGTELDGFDDDPVSTFDSWIREGEPIHQLLLKTPQERAPVRRAMRKEIGLRKTGQTREQNTQDQQSRPPPD
ncbi:MAG: hypothetical protein F4Y75_02750 [Acidimicrobiia bacterium]|nr:hypothetical protein [bacterium]MXX64563.1 hypothetical protein [Acidimicrobiia bacterium]MXZ06425.1 hypothetical protein [Acidimicrobiia bacterium]MYD04415.1 hypothetical protein [Acidimicrobiia bacterium]MYF26574.1 hypothetical protein [Acidimicrobiia bacterium]